MTQDAREDRLSSLQVETRVNKMFIDQGGLGSATLAAHESVQSPDAADRNLTYVLANDASGQGVQSPDAIERNTLEATFSSEPRDVAPVWIGEYTPPADSHAAPIEFSPEAWQSDDIVR